ncbi:hypothetical protein AB4865_07440 [Capnocytophaga sp. ARDL2]|uniref:hypothetical protein n=1 Tax=Capnocytophaga sp. ARDL2 TaxID=3238809 RepID=UPI003556BBE9
MELIKQTKDSSLAKIQASYLDENAVVLTEKQQLIKNRLAHAWGLRLNDKYSPHQIIQILMREHKISQATAYRDYNWAMQIFGNLDATYLAAEKQVLKEALWDTYQRAKQQGELAVEIKALKEYRSLFNFDESENQVDPNKIQAHEYRIQLVRWAYPKLAEMFEGGVLDFNNLNVEDVEFKEQIQTDEDEQD